MTAAEAELDSGADVGEERDGSPEPSSGRTGDLPVTGRSVEVCSLEDLEPVTAAAARVDGVQIALVRLPGDVVYAVDHRDPRTGSCTIARGIVGSKGGEPTIAAPLYKEVYSLVTGRCLSSPQYRLVTHVVDVRDGRVFVMVRQPAPSGEPDPGPAAGSGI